jgi:DHA1 family multidrug resistance protein-like MFS transporter
MIKEKFEDLKHMPAWQKNIVVLWFGTFMTGMGFSEIVPFMSFYINELGKFTTTQLNFYSGVTFAITFLVTAIVSPLWGRLADIKGRKLMLLRCSLGMAAVFALMGLSQNVWQLIGLRALQGVFAGFVSNANALIATETPKGSSGKALGILVTGITSGSLIGPLLGGVLANIFDYRNIFFVTGGFMLIVFFLSLFFVEETFKPTPHPKGEKVKAQKFRDVYGMLKHPRLVVGLVITTLIIQASNNSINPILSLYVKQMMHGHGNITLMAGIVAAIPGIATVIAAPQFGKLGDKVGTDRMLLAGFIWATLVFFLTTFVHDVYQLMFLRFLVGISDATMLPAVNTLLAKDTPPEITGRVFSYNQSFQSMGSVIGPMIGSTVSTTFGYGSVFLSTALLVLINMCLFFVNSKELRAERKAAKV